MTTLIGESPDIAVEGSSEICEGPGRERKFPKEVVKGIDGNQPESMDNGNNGTSVRDAFKMWTNMYDDPDDEDGVKTEESLSENELKKDVVITTQGDVTKGTTKVESQPMIIEKKEETEMKMSSGADNVDSHQNNDLRDFHEPSLHASVHAALGNNNSSKPVSYSGSGYHTPTHFTALENQGQYLSNSSPLNSPGLGNPRVPSPQSIPKNHTEFEHGLPSMEDHNTELLPVHNLTSQIPQFNPIGRAKGKRPAPLKIVEPPRSNYVKTPYPPLLSRQFYDQGNSPFSTPLTSPPSSHYVSAQGSPFVNPADLNSGSGIQNSPFIQSTQNATPGVVDESEKISHYFKVMQLLSAPGSRATSPVSPDLRRSQSFIHLRQIAEGQNNDKFRRGKSTIGSCAACERIEQGACECQDNNMLSVTQAGQPVSTPVETITDNERRGLGEIDGKPLHWNSQTTSATREAATARRKPWSVAKYACPYCSATFTRLYNLKGHVRAHNGVRPFKCDVPGCKSAFARLHDLKRHAVTHKRK